MWISTEFLQIDVWMRAHMSLLFSRARFRCRTRRGGSDATDRPEALTERFALIIYVYNVDYSNFYFNSKLYYIVIFVGFYFLIILRSNFLP